MVTDSTKWYLIRQARIAGIPLRQAVRLAKEYLRTTPPADLDQRLPSTTLREIDKQLIGDATGIERVQELLERRRSPETLSPSRKGSSRPPSRSCMITEVDFPFVYVALGSVPVARLQTARTSRGWRRDWRGRTLEERGRDFEGMVKRWKRNSQTVVAEFKRRKYYTPPSEQRRLAKAKAEKRARRAQMKRDRMERRNG